MCQHCCEDVVGLIYNQQNIEEMKVTKGTILENMATVLEQSHVKKNMKLKQFF